MLIDESRVLAALIAIGLSVAAYRKLRSRWLFAASVYSWGVVSLDQARWLSRALPLLEVAVVAALSVSVFAPRSAAIGIAPLVLAAFLSGFFTVGQLFLVWRRPRAACGCAGRARRVGVRSLATAAGFLVATLITLVIRL